MNPKDEAKEEKLGKFWWTSPPYYNTFEPSVDGGSYDLPAIISQARKLALQEAIEVVENEMTEEVNLSKHCTEQKLHNACNNCIQGRIWLWHAEAILSKLQGLIGKE